MQKEKSVSNIGRTGLELACAPISIGKLAIVLAMLANCLEFLVDVPTYFANLRGPRNSGRSDVTPALKWQISPVPGKVDLSAVFGVALPTGSVRIVGPGAQPYLQFPWSWELHSGWGLSGMFTEFFRPSDPASKLTTEATFVIEQRVTERE